jgi:hypothetical protein
LSAQDQAIVRQCLEFVVGSGALSGEFQTRMGVSEETVRDLLRRWPAVDHCGDSSPDRIVNNALNEVAHGVRCSEEEWRQWFDCQRGDVRSTFLRWKQSRARQGEETG